MKIGLLLLCVTLTFSLFGQERSNFKAKDYSYLFGMKGFSNDALKLHFKLY